MTRNGLLLQMAHDLLDEAHALVARLDRTPNLGRVLMLVDMAIAEMFDDEPVEVAR